MQTAAGGPIYEEDWSDKWEPYAAKIGLAGDVIGLGTAATGVGIPVGTAIAGFANIPNLIIDGYQTARDTWRSFNDNGNSLGSAAWNGGELILDATGLKALQYINKAAKAGVASTRVLNGSEKAATSSYRRVGTGAGRMMAKRSAEAKRVYNTARNKALKESNVELAKRGVRPV
jgi:TPR repeat protein